MCSADTRPKRRTGMNIMFFSALMQQSCCAETFHRIKLLCNACCCRKLSWNFADRNTLSPAFTLPVRMHVCVCVHVHNVSDNEHVPLTSMGCSSAVLSASSPLVSRNPVSAQFLNTIVVFLRCLSFSLFFSAFLNEWSQKSQTSAPYFLIPHTAFFSSTSYLSLFFSLSPFLLSVTCGSMLSFVWEMYIMITLQLVQMYSYMALSPLTFTITPLSWQYCDH